MSREQIRKIPVSMIEKYENGCNDDVIYYNISIPNNTRDRMTANFNQISQVPVLSNPSDYFTSIVRFSIPGAGIPIFRFIDDSYQITLSFGGFDATVPMIYSNVSPLEPGEQLVFSYNHFADMMNTAFQTAFTNLQGLTAIPVSTAPYFKYDPSTFTFSLYCETNYDPDVLGGPTVEIYFNNILYYLFDNFFIVRTGNQSPDYKDYRFVITNLGNNLIQSDPNNPLITALNPYYKNTQEYSTTYNFSDVKTIIFKSCLFPTQTEYSQTNFNQVLQSEQILTDFEPLQSLGDPSGFRGVIQYFASGSYRLINMTTNQPLYKFDLQISYSDELGNEYPLFIPRNSSVTVKLMFIKKSLYRSTYAH